MANFTIYYKKTASSVNKKQNKKPYFGISNSIQFTVNTTRGLSLNVVLAAMVTRNIKPPQLL